MKTLLVSLLAAASLTACATNRMNDTDRLAMYQANAGEPVRQIRYRNAMGWDRVDGSHVLLNMRPTEAWLLELSGNCLDWGGGSPGVQILSNSDWIVSKFDRLKAVASPVTCRIEEIRPIDVAGLRAAQKSATDQASAGT